MSLDPIWQQQLTLVTYGNEYLRHNLSFQRWLEHAIFDRHCFQFRDLNSQHLLAQHFQVWLEALKKQGVKQLSLHSSTLLADEKNPNPNVELLATPHIIVSHQAQQKTAWIFGKELAEWYSAEHDFIVPKAQQSSIRSENLWRFELNHKLSKRIEADLQTPKWDEIENFTEQELFSAPFAQDLVEPETANLPYYGQQDATDAVHRLALLPTDYAADYAHQTLYRLDTLSALIQTKIQHPYNAEGQVLTPDEQLNLRHFEQKIDDLSTKFIVKVANHYQTAQLTPKDTTTPLDARNHPTPKLSAIESKPHEIHHKSGKTGVFALIVITILICLVGYYFGL